MKAIISLIIYMTWFAQVALADAYSVHFQGTTVDQYHDDFKAPYSGQNSLSASGENKASFTSTLFLGSALWKNGEFYINPEASAGSGLTATHGIAGFPNGEIYRVSTPEPQFNISRIYLKQVFELGGDAEKIADDKNQIPTTASSQRYTFIFGKFSLNDFFDSNSYSHDPRTQFLNWSLMDNGAWDYAADTRGYTWGLYLEYHTTQWTLRYASVLEPQQANQMDLDMNIAQAHGDNLELEYHYSVSEHPGIARVLAYVNHAYMGSYQQTLSTPLYNTDITQTRNYRTKYGFGLNLEQEITKNFGGFMRLGWNDGQTESWAFTEVDETISLGASLKGTSWRRPEDTAGVAGIINGLSNAHSNYLASGGYGFLIGDGTLNYGPEQILETYYSLSFLKAFAVSLDYQFVNNPAYNRDRGPVSIYSGRLHCEL